MLPLLARNSPDKRLMSVVLPAPLGPITACTSPASSASDTSATAARPPNWRLKPRTTRRGSAMVALERMPALHKPGDAFRQQQHGGDDEEAHRQEPMLARGAQRILEEDER